MADVSSATKFFPTAKEGFTTTTSGSISSGAATVGLNSVSGYSNGEVVALVIDPTDSAKKQVFTGTVDTSGVQITGVVWSEGTNVAHASGATVVDYETATAWALYAKGILVEHNNDGTHDETVITSRTEDTSPAAGDYLVTSDVSASNALKKVTVNNLQKAITFDWSTAAGLSNPYKFSAQSASGQTGVASATNTTVVLGTENFDTNSNFAANTYTAPVAGFYQFNASIAMDNSVEGSFQSTGQARLLKNGATEVASTAETFDNGWSADSTGVALSALVQLAAGDTIVLQGQATVSSGTITFQSGAGTQLSGFLVSRT